MSSETKSGGTQFQSRWGFILASIGSAVGMANVWGFPAKVGQNGGGAFIVAYLLFIILFGVVALSAEFAIGRRSGTGTVGSYELAWATRSEKLRLPGRIVGWLPLAGSMCIALGYACIIAYIIRGLMASITGELMNVDAGEWFGAMSGTPFSVVPYHVVVVVVTLATMVMGAATIEKTNKVMMPVFFIIFIVLLIRVAIMPGAIEGYKFMYLPDWSRLAEPMVWIWAMAQAFFSLSVTGSGMIVYGAYLNKEEDIVGTAKMTALFDTIAAMVAAMVIIPACFAYNLDIAAGPSLLFVVLPTILADIPMGQLFAIILYLAMAFAGISSLQNMLEVVGESLMKYIPKLSRNMMLVVLGVVCLGIGVFMEPIYKWGPWMDLVSIYIIPIGATIGAISWFWIMKREDLMDEINHGAKKPYGTKWYYAGKFLVVPCAIILCGCALILKIAF